MQNQINPYKNLPTLRLVAYVAIVFLLLIQWLMRLSTDSWLGLLAYALFFLATLTLCQSKRRAWVLGALLVIVILATTLVDSYAFTLSTEMPTAMLSMKMMTAVTIIQNGVLSLYLLGTMWLLWREPNKITQLLGYTIAVFIAVRLLPATWFTLQFIISAV